MTLKRTFKEEGQKYIYYRSVHVTKDCVTITLISLKTKKLQTILNFDVGLGAENFEGSYLKSRPKGHGNHLKKFFCFVFVFLLDVFLFPLKAYKYFPTFFISSGYTGP